MIRHLYHSEVRPIDDGLSRLFSTLQENGVYDDTSIFVSADHGEEFFEHGVFGHPSTHLYEELVNVPLIFNPVTDHDVPSTTVEQSVALLDIAPTLCQLGGVAVPDENEGRSLLPVIRGESDRGQSSPRGSQWAT